jgi:hypothetical protein
MRLSFGTPRKSAAPQSLTENASSIFRLFLTNCLNMIRFFVMAGLDPAIHVFLARVQQERGCPVQGRA